MWKKQKDCIAPKNINAKIWRYIDFTKFVSMLENNALFFSRADKLGDPFEGSLPTMNRKFAKSLAYKRIERLQQVAEQTTINNLNKDSDIFDILQEVRKDVYVNCWHLNQCESAAMWKLYLKSDEGIAIQSSYKRLKDCLKKSPEVVNIGKVKYIDYDSNLIYPKGGYGYYMHKRNHFEHEHEIRALVFKLELSEILGGRPRLEDGIFIPVNLNTLIDQIVVSPHAPLWLGNLIKSVVRRYNLRKKVVISKLTDRPVFS